MQKMLWSTIAVVTGISTNFAYSQEIGLATFQEVLVIENCICNTTKYKHSRDYSSRIRTKTKRR